MFTPDIILKRITDITPAFLEQRGIKALILDVDNTLSTHGSQTPYDGVLDWIAAMQSHGIQLILASNNFARRVSPFAKMLGLTFVSSCCKPFPFGLSRVIKRLSVPKKQVAIVGDQIFTDILGGNFKGILTILAEPIQIEQGFLFRFKRKLERPFILHYYKRGGEQK